MEPRQVKTVADARRIVKERGLTHVKVGVHDIDGILRGKYIHLDKFHSALEGGFGFCDVVLGWDINDQLYDNVTYTGWHTGYPDANVRILPETCREIATEPGNLMFLCEFVDKAAEICPRGILQRVLARAFAGHGSATPAAGLSFYDFGSAEQRDALAQRLRTALAALPAEGAEADAAVDEALWAFEQHLRLFDALGAPA